VDTNRAVPRFLRVCAQRPSVWQSVAWCAH
jgi:hypothetical protein